MKRTIKAALHNTALAAFTTVTLLSSSPVTTAAVFAKYDGIDGEATDANHDKWIDVLSVDWGMHRPGGGATGATRQRGNVIVEDLTLTMDYEKAAPKLAEKCLMGEVIPKLEIELTSTYGGSRATYLKYELTNVLITSYHMKTRDKDGDGVIDRPLAEVSLNFEEIKVTYTENDAEGKKKGNVEYSWKVEEGEG